MEIKEKTEAEIIQEFIRQQERKEMLEALRDHLRLTINAKTISLDWVDDVETTTITHVTLP